MNAAAGRGRSARAWRIGAATTAALLILAALVLGALRLAVAMVPGNADRIAAWVRQQTDLSIEYADLDARVRWFGPEVVLRNVRVLDRDGTQALFETREASVGLDLWNLFRTGELVAGRVRFLGPEVTIVRLADGRIRLLGQSDRPSDRPPFDLDRLPAGRVEIRDATVTYRDLMTGEPPLTLSDATIALRRQHGHVGIAGSGRLPDALGTSVEFNGRLKGSIDRFTDLDARVELSVDRLQLPGLARFLPAGVAAPLAGSGSVSAVVGVAGGRLTHARLDLDLEDVNLRLPARTLPAVEAIELSAPHPREGAPPMSMHVVDMKRVQRPAAAGPAEARYSRLAGSFRVRRDGETWVFRAQDVRLATTGRATAAPASVVGRWRGDPRTRFAVNVTADNVQLPAVWPLVLALAPRGFDPWAGLNPTGAIRSLRADILRERAGSWPQFALSADVAGLSVQPSGRAPGIAGVSGVISGTDQHGRLSLRSTALWFDWPRIFRAPISEVTLAADADWRRDGEAWVLDAHRIELAHPGAHAHGAIGITYAGPGRSPVLDMQLTVDDADIALAGSVMPYGHLGEGSVSWLAPAFLGGRVDEGHVAYHGPVAKFPFRNGEGDFLATARVSGARVDYFSGFQPLENGTGTAVFHNAGFEAKMTGGEVGGLRITRADVAIPDFHQTVVEVDAAATGDLGRALAVVQGSPLGPTIGAQMMQLGGHGPADYLVRLHLPTHEPEMVTHDVYVAAALRGVDVTLPALRAPVQGVRGTFELHNLEMRAKSLRGTMLDGPFELDVEPGPLSPTVTASVLLHGRGHAAGARLPAYIGLPEAIRMSGDAAWKLEGRLERRAPLEQWVSIYDITSDLVGLGIVAPAPFAKEPAEARATHVALELSHDGREEVAVDTGPARARLLFVDRDGKAVLDRGIARFDGKPAVLPTRPGVRVEGDWPEFDLGEWLALGNSAGSGPRLSDWLGPVDVHLDRARVVGFEFSNVTAHLLPQPDTLQITVSGPMAEGQVSVPMSIDGGAPIRLDMTRLVLKPGARAAHESTGQADPRSLPALRIEAGDFAWEDRRFGHVLADIAREPQGLRLRTFTARSPSFSIDGRGAWLAEAAGSRTTIDVELTSTNLGETSAALGIPGAIEAENARARASLAWPGGPSADLLKTMSGTLAIRLDHGQLRDVKPGAGRMLGLTSLAELPRRLTLDFHDVTDAGLAFDTARGDFEIRGGNAYTQDLLLKGPAVDIGIVGRTGLVAEDYDQTVVVSGNPSGPITVAGALAAGPIGAAGGLLLSQIFKGQLQGLTRIYYRVTGPWANPVIERVSAQAGENLAAEGASKESKKP